MIRQIEIEGFKSIDRLKFKPGRVTVLIGENGCGKSNILEAIAMAGAAAAGKLDHEFLAPRGIRVTDSRLMRPAFPGNVSDKTYVSIAPAEGPAIGWNLVPQGKGPSDWREAPAREQVRTLYRQLETQLGTGEARSALERALRETTLDPSWIRSLLASLTNGFNQANEFQSFLVYAPENTALRKFQVEGQILPLGVHGEGLFAHLRRLQADRPGVIAAISDRLKLIDWFDGFDVPTDLAPGEHRLDIRDRYLDPLERFDQRSANEGFLFLLFYFTLLISPETPRFFAIDNIDASLNPRLCARLMKEIAALAEAHDKQVIVTTHNPAILDGLNLEDDDQRLFVVSRRPDGPTRIRRVKPPKPVEGEPPMRLSEAFIWGHLGGLPTNF